MAIASLSRLHALIRDHSQVVEANYLAANSERLLPTIWHLAIAALTVRLSIALLFYDHFLTFELTPHVHQPQAHSPRRLCQVQMHGGPYTTLHASAMRLAATPPQRP